MEPLQLQTPYKIPWGLWHQGMPVQHTETHKPTSFWFSPPDPEWPKRALDKWALKHQTVVQRPFLGSPSHPLHGSGWTYYICSITGFSTALLTNRFSLTQEP